MKIGLALPVVPEENVIIAGKFQSNVTLSANSCLGTIKRIKVGGRSAHFCDCHQKI